MKGHKMKRGWLFGSLLAMGLGLSACTSVDQMFDNGSAAPARNPAAAATPREEARARSLRCDGISDERSWLNCYYGAAQPVRGELGLPPAPASQQSLVPAGP
jgi:hypothetical protein